MLKTDAAATETKGTITVAASATPHAEILAAAKPILAEQGWDLEVTEFDDYVLPNEVVESGEMDANYFQHVPYLDSFNEEKGTHLVESTMSRSEFIREPKQVLMKLLMEIPLQYRTTLPTRHVHCFFCRIMESSL